MIAHANLSASSAHRWMRCGASVRLSALAPDDSSSGVSPYAAEGTLAHALAAHWLEPDKHAAPDMTDVDAEMEEIVGEYVAYVREALRDGWLTTERRFSLAALNPPDDMFGTSDVVGYTPANQTLHVIDLKYGRGHRVEGQGNPQLQYYALGAMLAVREEHPDLEIRRIRTTIYQPRIQNIASAEYDLEEIAAFTHDLMRAARAALRDDTEPVPGDWCLFCKGAPYCSAKGEQTMALMQMEFAEPMPSNVLPPPSMLTEEQRTRAFAVMEQVEDWFRALREWARTELNNGRAVPGMKLVLGRQGNRKWTNPEDALALLNLLGYNPETLVETKLRSPAQVEKLVRKTDRDALNALVTRNGPAPLLVTEDDPRPAAHFTAFTGFTALAPASIAAPQGE